MTILKLISAVLFITSFVLFAQEKPAIIEVTGSAEIKIEPDLLEMTVNINVDNEDLSAAKTSNDGSTSKVLAALKKLNIQDKDIRTSGITMQKVKDTYKNKEYFTVNNSVEFKTSSISLYESITEELIKIDNVYILNTQLTSTKAIDVRAKAREDALLAAKKKAEEMAAVFNMTIGNPVMITENQNSYYPNPFNNVSYNMQPLMESNTDIFKSGLISISSSVKVVFLLK